MDWSGRAGAVCLAVICAGVLTVLTPMRTCPAAKPATAPAKEAANAEAAKKLAGYIQIIKTHKDPSVVLRTYTKACAINRMDPELNSVYMRRMLLLGRPRAAYMSARILSAQDSDPGLAWATIGYMMGRSNKYLDALTATARALEFNSDDPSILNNVGQLAAWFDNAAFTPKLGDREKRILDKLQDKFAKSKVYKDAYARINDIYVTTKARRADLQAKLTADEAEYNKVRTAELTMRAQLKRLKSQFLQETKKLKELEKDLRKNRNRLNARDELGRYIYNRDAILAENTRIQNQINIAEGRKNALLKEATPVGPKVRSAAARGRKLRKTIQTHRATLKGIKPAILRQLRWDPPSVDGVFTAETTNLPPKIKPSIKPKKKVTASDSEVAAAKRLKMAKLYASHDKFKKAREIILEILEKHPKTKAATQAASLLKTFVVEPPAE